MYLHHLCFEHMFQFFLIKVLSIAYIFYIFKLHLPPHTRTVSFINLRVGNQTHIHVPSQNAYLLIYLTLHNSSFSFFFQCQLPQPLQNGCGATRPISTYNLVVGTIMAAKLRVLKSSTGNMA